MRLRSFLSAGLLALGLGAVPARGRAVMPDAPAPAPPAAAPAFPCGPARHVRSPEEVLAALTDAWPRPGTGITPVTVELIADVALTVRADRLPGPAYCTARCTHKPRRVDCTGSGDPCRVPVRFRVNAPVPGIQVEGRSEAQEGVRLQIQAGTRFRLRQRVLEYHPETPYYDPIVTAEPSCEQPCKPDERRCAATALCVPAQPEAYCLTCRGLSRPACACTTPDGQPKPDATICTFLSGDYFPTGTCKSGRCEIRR